MIDLRLDDFTTMEIPDNWREAVDIIVTDPPYAKEALPLYRHLGRFAANVLKRKGSLVTIVPHRYMPEAVAMLSESLEYRWVMAMYQPRINARLNQLGIFVRWKPLVWMVKDSLPRQSGYRPDAFTNEAPDKSLHKWQQSEQWAAFCLHFMPTGGRIVCDPMMGTGTVGVLAKRLGLRFFGIDKDPAMFAKAGARIEGIPWPQPSRPSDETQLSLIGEANRDQ